MFFTGTIAMIKDGESNDKIGKYTGLTDDEIEQRLPEYARVFERIVKAMHEKSYRAVI